MKKVVDRKCNACKQPITIQRDNVQGVVYYKELYYHTTCFCELAQRRSQLKRGKPVEWKDALDNVEEYERYAREILSVRLPYKGAKDDLNDYVLSQYNVTAIPGRFWQVVADLNKGIYKNKRCKKVSTEILLEAWKWGQKKLNEIDKYNRAHHKGPTDDQQRVVYDLAIIVGKIPNYLSYKAKNEAAKEEAKTITHINYDNMQRTDSRQDGLDDISDLLDEF